MRTAIDPVLEALAASVGDRDPIEIRGHGTHGDVGGAVVGATRTVTAPSGVISYDPAEMIVTVRAGTTVAELHDALAEHDQITSLPDGGTVGGALAVGFDGLFALGRGRCRDALLQVRYVSAQGKVITGGAPVVKNVSGFDLPRLLVGSLGTLGVIGEVVLRTNPLPPIRRRFRGASVDPFTVFDRIARPQLILWDGDTTWIELGGHRDTVERDVTQLGELGDWAEDEDLPALPEHRWSLPPAQLRRLGAGRSNDGSSNHGSSNHDSSTDVPGDGRFVAMVGTGTVFASVPQPPRDVSAPLRELHQRIKAEFDPTNRLNPGRATVASADSPTKTGEAA